VQLSTKLTLFSPGRPVRRRHYTLRRCAPSVGSVEDFEKSLQDLGWIVRRPCRRDTRVFKICSGCNSNKLRREFGNKQWRRQHDCRRCKGCTSRAREVEAEISIVRALRARQAFVAPLPRPAAPLPASPSSQDGDDYHSTAAAVQQKQQQYNSSSSSTAAAAVQQHLQPNVEGTEPLQVYIYRDGEDSPACIHCVAGDPDSSVLERGWGSPQVVMPRVRDRPMPPDLRAPRITKGDMVTAFMQIGIWIRVTCDSCLLGGFHGAIWPHWLGSWSSAASLGLSAAVYYAKGTDRQCLLFSVMLGSLELGCLVLLWVLLPRSGELEAGTKISPPVIKISKPLPRELESTVSILNSSSIERRLAV